MRRRSLIIGLALAAVPLVCGAQSTSTLDTLQRTLALTPDPSNGKRTYTENCVPCHQLSGWGNGPRRVPDLAGQQDAYLLEQLLQFTRSERKNDAMHALLGRPKLEKPQTLRDLSAFLAEQPRNPHPDHGDGASLVAGERVYRQSCEICHGKDGRGTREDLIPAIGGQHYGYLLVRLRSFARNHGATERGSIEPAIVNLLSGLSSAELAAVADYTSRLPALESH